MHLSVTIACQTGGDAMARRPLSGALIGVFIGLGVAVVLARLGVWPPDQLTVFLLPALTGLLGMLILSMGRVGSTTTMVISLIILIPMLIWGALGFAKINQRGELNGGCAVMAASDADTTSVTDTSRADPFLIESLGGLAWRATSPEAFMDYEWRLHAVIGGIAVPIESGTEANTDGDTENAGDVPNVGEYASARGIDLNLYRGLYEVGGFAATCDGFGFVEISGDGADPIAIGAVVLIVLLLILLLVLLFTGRTATRVESSEAVGAGNVDIPGALGPYEAGSEETRGDKDGS